MARGWLPGALAAALVAGTLAPWGGLAPRLAFPDASWLTATLALAALAVTPLLPPAAAGAAWLAVALAFGPPQPPPADRPGLTLTAASPTAALPESTGTPYVLDLALANAAHLPAGTLVASLRLGARERGVHAGAALAEWALHRPGARVAHGLPARPVFRPGDVGAHGFWSVGGRLVLDLPAGVVPALARAPGLADPVTVVVAQAGPARPTPPRDWPLPAWLLAAALAVAAVQLASRTWERPTAWLPWALLAAGALAARLPVEPLRLLAERHAVDLALAAFLTAWLPAARRWLAAAHPFLAALALLLPLAAATPHLAQPIGDGSYHLLLVHSLVHDRDLDLGNNFDLERYPNQRIYVPFGGTFLHSPVLAVLLAPGYALAGRAGALGLLGLAGAALVSLLWRRARELGVSPRRLGDLALATLLSYPLVTFATEMWTELPGALAVTACLGLAARPVSGRGVTLVATLLGAGIKTRFALALGPLLVAAWWPRDRRKRTAVLAGLAVLATVAALSLALTALLGNPLDPLGRRSLLDVARIDVRHAFRVVGGLLFDAAGGLLFAAPLGLVALGGVPALARRGGRLERGLMVAAVLTVGALLHLQEWRGGDSPPVRYLVPLLPLAVLGGAMVVQGPRRWRPLAWVLVPPTLVVSWVAATRPGLLVNAGDGGFWLANAIARRGAADALDFFPSFLRPGPAAWAVPLGVMTAGTLLVVTSRRRAACARAWRAATVAVWLGVGGALLAIVARCPDRTVEVEDPQVRHLGGRLDPPPGTFLRYLAPSGWRLGDREGVEIPLTLLAGDQVALDGRVETTSAAEVRLLVAWPGQPARTISLAGPASGLLRLPAPPGRGRYLLGVRVEAPADATVVLDRLLVSRSQ